MSVQEQSYNIGGIKVQVFQPASPASKSVAVLFLLHGRQGNSEHVREIAHKLVKEGTEGKRGRRLCVVTLNHRNHGDRTVEPKSNNSWTEEPANELHALDMYAIQVGTMKDISFLIDFLPAYVFPHGEATVEAWGVAGISLGGHSTWLALAHDPRVELGIPIIGCPDYITLIRQRAAGSGVAFAAPQIPASFVQFVEKFDPAATQYTATDSSNPFFGKKVLVLSGEIDTLVPWTASKAFVDALEVGSSGRKKVVVQKGTGHETTDEMVSEAVEFVREELT